MAQDGNLFAALFPTEAEQIQKIAQASEAPQVGETVKTQAPVVPYRSKSASTAPGSSLTPTLVQHATPRALTAAYLAAQALGDATLTLESIPLTADAQGEVSYEYPVPPNQVLVLLNPLSVQSRRHSEGVTANVTVDNEPILVGYALTHDEGVLLAEESVVTHKIEVSFQNKDWVDTSVTVVLSGVLVSVQTYQNIITPILQGVVQTLSQGGTPS